MNPAFKELGMPDYKNRFDAPEFIEKIIFDENGAVLGTIRIKPSGVLWKPKGARKFFSIPLAKFTDWITDPKTKARKTGS